MTALEIDQAERGCYMSTLRVLVLDDEPQVVAEARAALESMGHIVCGTAATERAAVASARTHKPDLVVASPHLRIGDGMAAIRRICDERPVPHIFLAENRALLLSRMPDAIIVQKPFKPGELHAAVKRACTASA
jgi:DNA-binding response OmpR family regulator